MKKQFLIFISILFLGSVFQTEAQTQVWTSNGANKIQQLSEGSVSDLIDSGAITPWGIAVDVEGNRLYWTNVTEGTIKSAALDGSDVQTLMENLDLPRGIALDAATNTLFWAEGGVASPGIKSVNLDENPLSTTDVTTSGVVSPYHIALDTAGEFVYWADNASSVKEIKRVKYNGTGSETIVSNTNVKQVAGIALDAANNTLFWGDFEDDIIYSADADAEDQNIQTVSTITGDSTPWAIAVDEQSENLYWTDYLNSRIFQVNLGTSAQTELVSSVSTPSGFATYSGQVITPNNPTNFITTWKTDNPGDSNNDQITIPTVGGGYNYNVYWEDVNNAATNSILTGQTGVVTIDFPAAGIYRVEISGDFPRIYFNDEGDKEKIISIDQWGNIAWSSMNGAFYGASEMEYNATDVPGLLGVTDLTNMFRSAAKFNGDLSGWQVGTITDMTGLFFGAEIFNGDISGWDVSQVTSMRQTFHSAAAFNQDISGWQVGEVETMQTMFFNTSAFNQDLTDWDVGKVTNMRSIFNGASVFNGNISDWDPLLVEDFSSAFFNAPLFNADISGWDVSSAKDMSGMFENAAAFNHSLSDWDVEKVTSMTRMLDGTALSAANYDATLTGWAALTLQNNVPLGAGGLEYCSAASDRQSIIDTYSWDITDDSFSCPPPTASDGRIFTPNTTPYRFAGSDFNPEGLADAITIETLPSEGILQLNEADVTVGDEIPLTDINDNKLRWLPSVEYGYGYTSFDYRTSIIGDKASEDAYSMTIDVGSGFVELSGPEGWRFMSNPSDGDTYNDLFSDITVNLDFPTRQTLYELDQPNYDWDPVESDGDEPGVGTPFIVYVVDEDLPVTIIAGTNWSALDGVFSYSGLDFTDTAPNPDSFYLLGNPHPVAVDFCEFTSSDVAVAAYFWDPEAGGGNGDYITQSCAVDTEVPISPFQAFWVRTTAVNPSLEIPKAAYLGGTEAGYFKDAEKSAMSQKDIADLNGEGPSGPEKSMGADRSLITLQVTGQVGTFTNTAHLLFDGEATITLDKWDAPKLSPEGLAQQWLSLYSMDEEGRSYAIQSLPGLMEDQTRIPLDIRTTEAGRYTLDWQLPKTQQLSSAYYLRDNNTGEVMELTDGNSYWFEIDEQDVIQRKQTGHPVSAPLQSSYHSQWSDDSQPRFELLITTDGSDGFAELGDLPESLPSTRTTRTRSTRPR